MGNNILLSVPIITEIVLKALRTEMAKMEMCLVLLFQFLEEDRASVLEGRSLTDEETESGRSFAQRHVECLVWQQACPGLPSAGRCRPPFPTVRLLTRDCSQVASASGVADEPSV